MYFLCNLIVISQGWWCGWGKLALAQKFYLNIKLALGSGLRDIRTDMISSVKHQFNNDKVKGRSSINSKVKGLITFCKTIKSTSYVQTSNAQSRRLSKLTRLFNKFDLKRPRKKMIWSSKVNNWKEKKNKKLVNGLCAIKKSKSILSHFLK